jgi:membrane associated rhomboid family serine protease
MAAAAIGMQRRGVNVFQTGIGAVLVINLVLTFTIPGISIGGHLGGAVAGAVCGAVMLAPSWKPSPVWATFLTPIAVAAAAVIGSVLTVG